MDTTVRPIVLEEKINPDLLDKALQFIDDRFKTMNELPVIIITMPNGTEVSRHFDDFTDEDIIAYYSDRIYSWY